MAVLAVDDDEHFTGDTKNTKFSFSQIMYDVWKSLAEDYLISVVRLKKETKKRKSKTALRSYGCWRLYPVYET